MQPWAESFYKSQQWQNCRNSYMKQARGLCEDCKAKGEIVPAVEVHHITFLTPQNITDPKISLNYENLVALCRECHRKRHGHRVARYNIDEQGRVSPK